jgi:hypothetical protein
MPPQGKLADQQIDDLATWIRHGAVWPEPHAEEKQVQARERSAITPEQRSFWSFQRVTKPAVPKVRTSRWPRAPLDRFVLARLEKDGLKPVGPADKRTLLRRAYLDMIGLPPTPEEVEAFLRDRSSDSFAKVVDQLLDSPRYGERWGRYWLDVARYSDDKLNSTQMDPYPHAYRYRDWVIRAFNDDMPYDLFLKAQLAGDLLDEGKRDDLAAGLGFYALSPQFQDDRIDATMRGFQALTVQCAQCHDHKFDPIPTEDYYALLGVFNSTEIGEWPLADRETVSGYKRLEERLTREQKDLDESLDTQSRQLADVLAAQTASYIVAAWEVLGPRNRQPDEVVHERSLDAETLDRWVKYLGHSPREHPLLDEFEKLQASDDAEQVERWAAEIETLAVDLLREKRKIDKENEIRLGGDANPRKANEVELLSLERDRHYLWRDLASKQGFDTPAEFESGILYYGGEEIDRFLAPLWRDHAAERRLEIEALKKELPDKYPFLHVIKDKKEPANEHVHIRGNKNNLGAEVPRRFLTILDDGKPFAKGSGRLELAEAIARPENPLTARVMVNRVWAHHFGRGIVDTPSNFGHMGQRPSHPELLDYLAARFVEEDWSIKAMHREIMLSATYALSTDSAARNEESDPENRLLWRANRRRLDAEALRDSLLYVTGNLEAESGGEPLLLTDAGNRRRTVYGYVSRRRLDKMLGIFDFPNPNKTSPQRIGTNTALQGLFFLNSEFMMRQAERLHDRLEQELGSDDAAKIRRAYRLLYGRDPSREEIRLGRGFVRDDPMAWPRYAQVLLSSNEFLYVQ